MSSKAVQVTEYNVGRWCLSENECIAQGISFAAYERGVADAAKAFGRQPLDDEAVAGHLRSLGTITWRDCWNLAEHLRREGVTIYEGPKP